MANTDDRVTGRLKLISTHISQRSVDLSNNPVQGTKATALLQQQSQQQEKQEGKRIIYAKFDDGYIVRQMERSDLPAIVELHAREGLVSCDFEVAFDSLEDRRGFIVGEYQGKPVAFCMVYRWSSDQQARTFYYGSGFIVDKTLRDRRLGSRIFEMDREIMKYKPTDVVLGDAVDAHRLQANVHRHQCVFHSVVEGFALDPVPNNIAQLHPLSADISIVACADVSLDAIMDYDALCFVSKDFPSRREFLRRWFQVRPGASYVALDKDGRIVGYACRRLVRFDQEQPKKFSLIGPLYADNPNVAETLILRHMGDVVGETIAFSILTLNTAAVSVVKRLGMVSVTQFFRNQWPAGSALFQHSPRLYVPTSLDVCGY